VELELDELLSPEADGVELLLLPEDDGVLEDDGLLLDEEDDEGLAEEPLLGVSDDEELELELGALELGVELELELLLGGVELGLELIEPEPDIEPLGLDLLGLVDEPELLLELPAGDDAPRLASGPLLQPYKLVTATAIGRTITAVFLRILICGAPLLNGRGFETR